MAGLQYRRGGGEGDGGEYYGDLCAATVCRGWNSGGGRFGDSADHLHYRGDSCARHGEDLGVCEELEVSADWAELSGGDFAGEGEGWDYAGADSQGRLGGDCF